MDNSLPGRSGANERDLLAAHIALQPYNPLTIDQRTAEALIPSLGIDWESVPKLPWFSGLVGYSEKFCQTRCAARCILGAYVLQRELEPQEKQALAEITSKTVAAKPYVTLLGPITSLAFVWWGFDKMKYPFWTPKPGKINTNVFPTQRAPLLKGWKAQYTWHVTRMAAYLPLCYIGVALVFGWISHSQEVTALRKDPRLAAFVQNARQRQQKMGTGRRTTPAPQPQNLPPDNSEGSASYSPFPDSTEQDQGPAGAYSGSAAWTPQAPPPSRSSQPVQETSPSSAWSCDDDGLYDDASPVAPSARQTGQPSTSSGGSSWDEIRKRAQIQSGANPQGSPNARIPGWAQRRQTTQQGASHGTLYTYGSADEEKAYAKEQAQKEFDAMLEAERRGQSGGRS